MNVLFEANRACTECILRTDCLGPVPAEGPMSATLAFIGEAPGYKEDKDGFPFRGPAGRYFDSLLRSIGVKREEVWVTNTTKCRPLKNRTPTRDEVEYCASRWLDMELAMVKPRIIVPMGDAAITHFLGEGTVYGRHGVPIAMEAGSWGTSGITSIYQRKGKDGNVGSGKLESFLLGMEPSSSKDDSGKPTGLPGNSPMDLSQQETGSSTDATTPDALDRITSTLEIDRTTLETQLQQELIEKAGKLIAPQIIPIVQRILTTDPTGTGSVESAHGIETDSAGHQVVVLPIYHPASGLHRVELMTTIQEDFLTLKEVIEGSWEPMVDQYPDPQYRDCSLDLPGEDDGRLVAVDTEWVEGKLWSVQCTDKPGEGSFYKEAPKLSNVVVHNYLADAQYIDLPEHTRDTMLMAYLLGLPQGLKGLAKRLCGMDMDSYEDMVGRYGKEKALEYLQVGTKVDWPDPPVLEDFTWDKKTNTLGMKQKTPQHISKKIARILADVRAGKVTKAGPVDPYSRWHSIDSRERAEVEAVLGRMPDGNLEDVPGGEAVVYSCRDADATLRVDGVLWPQIVEKGLQTVFEMDMDTYPVAMEMMKNGIKVDSRKLRELADTFSGLMVEKSGEIFKEAAKAGSYPNFNPNSNSELVKLFFDHLGFKPTKLTRTGLPSVAGEELAKIDHPLVKLVEEYRHVQHLKDSFCDTLPGKADTGGRVHPTIRTTRTATGRWSMADPNCQQIPVRTELGREIRKAFIAEEGNVLVAIDYSQIELRVAAHLSQCQSMMQAFKDGRDIHTETARRLFGLVDVEPSQRYAAKTLNFGVIYGITAEGFQSQMQVEGLDWSVKDCELFIKESNQLRPELWVWQEETKAFARRNGYVMDMFGRRRLLPEILCPVRWIQSSGEREAINMPVQSGAQGLIKLAMGKLWQLTDTSVIKWLLQIHDELLWEMDQGLVEWFNGWAIPVMEGVVQLSVPVTAEVKTGFNWGEMKSGIQQGG